MILGVDPSSTRLGIALAHTSGAPVACWSTPLTAKGAPSKWRDRLASGDAQRLIRDAIATVEAKLGMERGAEGDPTLDVQVVYVEATDQGTRGGRTTWALGGATALVVASIRGRWPHAHLSMIPVPDYRPVVGLPGGGRVDKVQVVRRARHLGWTVPEIRAGVPDDDAADAALIATAAHLEAARAAA